MLAGLSSEQLLGYEHPLPSRRAVLLSSKGSSKCSGLFFNASNSLASGYFLLFSYARDLWREEGALREFSALGSDTLKIAFFLESVNASQSAFPKPQTPSWKLC